MAVHLGTCFSTAITYAEEMELRLNNLLAE